jgi:hypothetical protein
MIAMPLPCKILTNLSSSVTVDVITFGNIAKDVSSINPHSIGEICQFTWGNLSYVDVQTIETSLLSSKGTERFSYLLGVYSLEDGYTVEVQANKPIIKASFRRIQ